MVLVAKNLPANTGNTKKRWVPALGWEDPLEEETTTHSSILVWEIPCTEEPGVLQSMGLQRVRHDLAPEQQRILFNFASSSIPQNY